jgi:CheY-like chemotaxis protein
VRKKQRFAARRLRITVKTERFSVYIVLRYFTGGGCVPLAVHRRKIIVCIDDNRQGLAIRKLFLEALGYEVLLAQCAADGLDLLRQHAVAAVIVDFHMPDMGGDELASLIRRSFPGLPIVMLSGYVGDMPPACFGVVDRFVCKGEPATRLIDTLRELTS